MFNETVAKNNRQQMFAGKFAAKYGFTLQAGPDVSDYFSQMINQTSFILTDHELYTKDEIKAAEVFNRARQMFNL